MVLTKYRSKRPAYKKRAYKKKYVAKKSTKSLVKLIKKVSLKQCETKHTHQIMENVMVYHNSINLYNNMLATYQGINDTGTGTSQNSMRVGDQVVARGISLKIWLANKLDRPNVMYKIIIYKYQSRITPTSDTFLSQGSTNIMLRDFNTEKYSIVAQKTINLQVGFSAVPTGVNGDQDGKEAHKLLKFWIPLKNKKIQYEEANLTPKYFDYGFAVVAYDSYGTLSTDIIGTYAFNMKFYFKDP